jgi:hypothetical protein
MKTFTYYSDPGHGWLAVSHADVQDVGLTLSMFSPCSYERGDMAFLEEDCDAGLFVAAYRAKHGRAPAYTEKGANSDSPIRNYKRLPGTDYSFELWQERMRTLCNKAA